MCKYSVIKVLCLNHFQAGIPPQNLCIALEPEAAAVYYSVASANPPNDPKRDLDIPIWTGPKTINIIVDMGGNEYFV